MARLHEPHLCPAPAALRYHGRPFGASAVDALWQVRRTAENHCYHNPLIDKKSLTPSDYPVVSDDDLERLEDAYLEGAKLAYQAGFRSLDLKVTHGYLLSELLGAKQREGKYGGSLEIAPASSAIS